MDLSSPYAGVPPCRLIGVGVGPGDPELLTLKAVRAMETADVVLVPATETSRESSDGVGRAEAVVRAACPALHDRLQRVPFSMADTTGVTPRRRQAWEDAANAAVTAYEGGARTVAFATIGDPSVYSTFSYLAAHVRDTLSATGRELEIEVVPGITAMQAIAAASGTPLVEGTEVLALVPATVGVDRYAQVLDVADTVVAYKAGRRLGEVVEMLTDRGQDTDTVLGENIGLDRQRIIPVAEAGARAPYFATLLTTPHRGSIGGRL